MRKALVYSLLCVLASCGGLGGERAAGPSQAEGGGAGGGDGGGGGGGGGEGDGDGGGEGGATGGDGGPGDPGGEGEGGGGTPGGPGEGEGEGAGPDGEGDGGDDPGGGGDEGEGEGAWPGSEGEGDPVDAGPRPAAELTGVVNVTQVYVRTLADEPFRGNGGAVFAPTAPLPDAQGCRLIDEAAPAETRSAHAGVIRVTGGGRELLLTPTRAADGGWTYVSNLPESNKILFDRGDTLTFVGEGGPHAGPFRHAMDAPDRVSISDPAPPFDLPSRNSPVDVRWNGRDETAAILTVTSARGAIPTEPVAGPSILCTTDDDGAETISADLMGRLPQGDGFILSVSRIRVVQADIDPQTHLVLTAVMGAGMSVGWRR